MRLDNVNGTVIMSRQSLSISNTHPTYILNRDVAFASDAGIHSFHIPAYPHVTRMLSPPTLVRIIHNCESWNEGRFSGNSLRRASNQESLKDEGEATRPGTVVANRRHCVESGERDFPV